MAPDSMLPVPVRAQQRWALLAVCLAALALPLSFSAGAVAVPALARSAAASPTALAWVTNAFMLTFGSLLLAAGGRPIDMAVGGCSCWARRASPPPPPPSALLARCYGWIWRAGCRALPRRRRWHPARRCWHRPGRGRRVPVSSPCWAPRSAWGWRWGPCSRACCCRHWDGAACSPRAVCSRWWPSAWGHARCLKVMASADHWISAAC